MIKVLVVDDSAVARAFLVQLIESAGGMTVVGTAADGYEAIERVERLRPDIVTMDIVMPRMDGPEAIRRIMETVPVPIIVVTGNTITEEVRATFESLDSGALGLVPRPPAIDHPEHSTEARQLLETLRLMSEIRVVRRWPRRATLAEPVSPRLAEASSPGGARVVAIGASTGGPTVLKAILEALPADFPAPVLVVQHIAPGFVEGFVSWLGDACRLPVKLAAAGELLRPGRIYVAPDGAHFSVDMRECVSPAPEKVPGALCPSVTRLFESVARVYGARAVGVLLTGMGRDGADGLLRLRQAGALTIAQDRESSVVHGMPGEAIRLGAASQVLPPSRIPELLILATAGEGGR